MDFTREPIIDSIISPKSGCKLVVRSSKSSGQEEYFVDAVEIVSFGNNTFYRSVERPKSFLVPASDYEVIEVREARLVLKNVGVDRTIKIGGGREQKAQKEMALEPPALAEETTMLQQPAEERSEISETKNGRIDKRKEKRRNYRRRRNGRDEIAETSEEEGKNGLAKAEKGPEATEKPARAEREPGQPMSALLPPPSTLISETLLRYRENALFKDAFFVRNTEEEEGASSGALESSPEAIVEGAAQDQSEELLEALEMQKITLEPSSYGSFDLPEEEGQWDANNLTIHENERQTPEE